MDSLDAYLKELRSKMEHTIAVRRAETMAELESIKKDFEEDAVKWLKNSNSAENSNNRAFPEHGCNCKSVHDIIRESDRSGFEEISARIIEAVAAMEADMRKSHDENESQLREAAKKQNGYVLLIEGEGKTFQVGDYFVPPPGFPPL